MSGRELKKVKEQNRKKKKNLWRLGMCLSGDMGITWPIILKFFHLIKSNATDTIFSQ